MQNNTGPTKPNLGLGLSLKQKEHAEFYAIYSTKPKESVDQTPTTDTTNCVKSIK